MFVTTVFLQGKAFVTSEEEEEEEVEYHENTLATRVLAYDVDDDDDAGSEVRYDRAADDDKAAAADSHSDEHQVRDVADRPDARAADDDKAAAADSHSDEHQVRDVADRPDARAADDDKAAAVDSHSDEHQVRDVADRSGADDDKADDRADDIVDTLDYVPDASDTDDDTGADVREDVSGTPADVVDDASAAHELVDLADREGRAVGNNHDDDSHNAAVSSLPHWVHTASTSRSSANVHVCNDGFSNIQDLTRAHVAHHDVSDSSDDLRLLLDLQATEGRGNVIADHQVRLSRMRYFTSKQISTLLARVRAVVTVRFLSREGRDSSKTG